MKGDQLSKQCLDNSPGKPAKVRGSGFVQEQPRLTSTGKPLISAVMREVIGSLAEKSFQRDQMISLVQAKRPDADANTVAVNLLNMVSRGELSRKGAGAAAVFTVIALKEKGKPSAKELAYRELRAEVKTGGEDDEEGPKQ